MIWDPVSPVEFEYGTAQASLADIHAAQREASILGENTDARLNAYARAFDERNTLIRDAFGVELDNPIMGFYHSFLDYQKRRSVNAFKDAREGPDEARTRIWNEHHERYRRGVEDLTKRHPDALDLIGVEPDFRDHAGELAREAEKRLSLFAASRDGLLTYAALFSGGAVAALEDPLQAPLFLFGGGPGAARTIAGRILTVAGKEAAIAGGSELALQPFVQDWRREAGLSHGFGDAAERVAFATAFGGLFGGSFRGIYEGGAAGARALKARAPSPADDPAIRGATDAVDAEAAWRNSLPEDLPPGADDLAASRAIEVAEDPFAWNSVPGRQIGPSAREEAINDPDVAKAPKNVSEGAYEGLDLIGRDEAFGPVIDTSLYRSDWDGLVERMGQLETGVAPGALRHADIGEIDLVWGKYEPEKPDAGYGLSKIVKVHPEVVDDLPGIIARGALDPDPSANRFRIRSGDYTAVIRREFDGRQVKWLMTAFGPESAKTRKALRRRAGSRTERPGDRQADTSSASPAAGTIADPHESVDILIDPDEPPFDAAADGAAQTAALDDAARLDQSENHYGDHMVAELSVDADGKPVVVTRPLGAAVAEAERGNDLADIVDLCKVF